MITGYGMVQTEVMKIKGLSMQAKAVYSYLASMTGSKDYCFPKQETIAEDMGVSRQMIGVYIKELVDKKLIIKSKLFNDIRRNLKYEVCYIECKTGLSSNDKHTLHSTTSTFGTINNNKDNKNILIKKSIKEKPKNNECEKWLKYFNKICKTSYRSIKPIVKNFNYWHEIYSIPEMEIVIQLAQVDDWYKDKLTPTLLLRTKNKNGECDYIGELLNKYKGQYDLES